MITFILNTLGNTKIWENKDLEYILLTDFEEILENIYITNLAEHTFCCS